MSPSSTALSETEEVLFARLFMQAQDTASPAPILGDSYAQQYINQANCNFHRNFFITDPRHVKAFICRNKLHDQWLQHFLDIHAVAKTPVTVLQLGCALDSRNMRVNRGSSVRWVDVDTPEVVSFRRQLIPAAPGDYTLMSADMTETSWLDAIPADRPTYIIAEEFWMWQKPHNGKKLIRAMVNHFPRGQFATDMVGSVIKELHWLMPILKGSKLKFEWAINDGREFESLDRRLKLVQEVRWYEVIGTALRGGETPEIFGRWTTLASRIPGFKNCAQVVLLDYGVLPTSRRTMDSSTTESSGLSETSVTGVSFKGSGSSVGGFTGAAFSSDGRYSPMPTRSSKR
ncbi:S-adenosyl-L-methionine-dependent methyltransferase [Microdochium trichocladiopsis]|uniref:S-adenosyl-L-methionine-dependent methyltransferase n=1 Tax=Microdochium trichocladiopsis TaxID=1682393 RepID=A0A9P8XVB3_9PEZI|nr:S-adenosyl-L-methionine-dependent methyltransferase [Microdochium trichocladiopsis]KAH7018550.1 S-adenosyl-L-methionine-dependent methyltransferase [Microdochium trichocladiopsis]